MFGRILGLLAVASVLSFVQSSIAQQEAEMADLPERMLSATKNSRHNAADQLSDYRTTIVDALVENLKTLSAQPERGFGSAFHLTIVATGQWRVAEAAPILVQVVDFQLDPSTFPVGARRPISAYYPAANALAQIGGLEVVEVVFERLQQEAGEEVVRACAWVLKETLGAELAIEAINLKQKDGGNVHAQNLDQARKYIQGGGAILILPDL